MVEKKGARQFSPQIAVDGSGIAYTNALSQYVPYCQCVMTAGYTTGGDGGLTYPLPTSSFVSDVNGNFLSRSGAPSASYTDTKGLVLARGNSAGGNGACTGPLPLASTYNSPVTGFGGSSEQITLCLATVNIIPAFPTVAGVPIHEGGGPFNLLQSLVLPDGHAWTFVYDSFGELTSMTLPTGGTIAYQYATYSLCSTDATANAIDSGATPESRYVTSRTVNANDGTGPHQWTYTWNSLSTAAIPNAFSVTVQDPEGNQTVHTEQGVSGTCSFYDTDVKYYQGLASNGKLLKTVDTQYQGMVSPLVQYATSGVDYTAVEVFPTVETTTLSGGEVSQVRHTYDTSITWDEFYWPSTWQSFREVTETKRSNRSLPTGWARLDLSFARPPTPGKSM